MKFQNKFPEISLGMETLFSSLSNALSAIYIAPSDSFHRTLSPLTTLREVLSAIAENYLPSITGEPLGLT